MKKFFLTTVILSSWVLFVSLHLFFLKAYLYWYVSWLDIFMHSWGGVLLVVTSHLINRAQLFPRYSRQFFSHPVVVLLAFVIVWEIFRYAIAPSLPTDYIFDTTVDLFCGVLGGLLAYFFLSSRTIKNIL